MSALSTHSEWASTPSFPPALMTFEDISDDSVLLSRSFDTLTLGSQSEDRSELEQAMAKLSSDELIQYSQKAEGAVYTETPALFDEDLRQEAVVSAAQTAASNSSSLWHRIWGARSGQSPSPTAHDYQREGSRQLNKHHYQQAIRFFEKAIELGADGLECQLNLGLSYARVGRLDEAIALLAELKATHPQDPGVATLLGKALLYRSRYRTAIKVMRPVADRHKDRYNLQFFLGLAYAKSGEYDEAIDAWSQAIKIRPDSSQTRRMLSLALDAKRMQKS